MTLPLRVTKKDLLDVIKTATPIHRSGLGDVPTLASCIILLAQALSRPRGKKRPRR